MALQAGKYTIRSKATSYFIGRHTTEDKSLHPKMILALQRHQEIPKWEFEAVAGGFNRYIVKTRGTPTTRIDGLVFALMVHNDDDAPLTIWEIKPRRILGRTYYTIGVARTPGALWAAPGHDEGMGNGQVAVKTIPTEPGFPDPPVPSNMLFIIEEAE